MEKKGEEDNGHQPRIHHSVTLLRNGSSANPPCELHDSSSGLNTPVESELFASGHPTSSNPPRTSCAPTVPRTGGHKSPQKMVNKLLEKIYSKQKTKHYTGLLNGKYVIAKKRHSHDHSIRIPRQLVEAMQSNLHVNNSGADILEDCREAVDGNEWFSPLHKECPMNCEWEYDSPLPQKVITRKCKPQRVPICHGIESGCFWTPASDICHRKYTCPHDINDQIHWHNASGKCNRTTTVVSAKSIENILKHTPKRLTGFPRWTLQLCREDDEYRTAADPPISTVNTPFSKRCTRKPICRDAYKSNYAPQVRKLYARSDRRNCATESAPDESTSDLAVAMCRSETSETQFWEIPRREIGLAERNTESSPLSNESPVCRKYICKEINVDQATLMKYLRESEHDLQMGIDETSTDFWNKYIESRNSLAERLRDMYAGQRRQAPVKEAPEASTQSCKECCRRETSVQIVPSSGSQSTACDCGVIYQTIAHRRVSDNESNSRYLRTRNCQFCSGNPLTGDLTSTDSLVACHEQLFVTSEVRKVNPCIAYGSLPGKNSKAMIPLCTCNYKIVALHEAKVTTQQQIPEPSTSTPAEPVQPTCSCNANILGEELNSQSSKARIIKKSSDKSPQKTIPEAKEEVGPNSMSTTSAVPSTSQNETMLAQEAKEAAKEFAEQQHPKCPSACELQSACRKQACSSTCEPLRIQLAGSGQDVLADPAKECAYLPNSLCGCEPLPCVGQDTCAKYPCSANCETPCATYTSDFWAPMKKCEFLMCALAAVAMLCTSFLLTYHWLANRKDHSALQGPRRRALFQAFNSHCLYMMSGLITNTGLAILQFRILRWTPKRIVKTVHMSFHLLTVLLIFLGMHKAVQYHGLHKPSLPHLVSLHSWLGVISIGIFFLQSVIGGLLFAFFSLMQSTDEHRNRYRPIHGSCGKFVFAISIATCFCGLNRYGISLGKEYTTERIFEGKIVNGIGLTIAFALLCVFTILGDAYRRSSYLPLR